MSLQGDGEAFARLIRRYQGQAAADLSRFTRDPRTLDELTQDVFVQAYYSLKTYRAEVPFGHWLRKITVRVGYRFLKETSKRHARGGIEADEEIPDETRAPADSPEEAAARVQALLERLPPRDRLVLTLMYLDDLSVAEIADRTGWSRIMVKVQAFRARQRLKRLLGKEAWA